MQLKQLAILLGIVAVAAVLYSLNIQNVGLWADEGYTYGIAQLSVFDIVTEANKYVVAPPLWYLLVKPFLELFPGSPWVIRIPSLLAVLLVIVLLFTWLRRNGGGRVAFIGASLAATSPMLLFYAQTGRNYAVLGLLYLTAFVILEVYGKTGRRKVLLWLALIELGMLYLHSYGAVLFGVIFLYFFVFRGISFARKHLGEWLVVHAVVFLCFLPWFNILMDHTGRVRSQTFMVEIWALEPPYTHLFRSIRNLVPGGIGVSHPPIPSLLYYAWVPVVIAGFYLLASRPWRYRGEQLRPLVFALGPLVAIIFYSLLLSPVYVVGRTEAMVVPVFILFAARSFETVKSEKLRYPFASLFVLSGLITIVGFHTLPIYQGFWRISDRATVDLLLEGDPPKVIFVCSDLSASIFAHLDARQPDSEVIWYPDPEGHPGPDWIRRFPILSQQLRPLEAARPALEAVTGFLDETQPDTVSVVMRTATLEDGSWGAQPIDLALIHFLEDEHGMRVQGGVRMFPAANMGFEHLVFRLARMH